NKPTFTPPNWLFAPAWTLLFLLMGIALYLISESKSEHKNRSLVVFGIQLFLNFFWNVLFFGLKNPALALAEIVLLWFIILYNIYLFMKINKVAGWLMVPYLLWVAFATLLNYYIYMLN
ncbi:MAG TPA: tryptophan-rich sensory protein, partial [bacterium]|nr:tryptophan-rich sensory protein [bacterium]